jgi:hypothetical protein
MWIKNQNKRPMEEGHQLDLSRQFNGERVTPKKEVGMKRMPTGRSTSACGQRHRS